MNTPKPTQYAECASALLVKLNASQSDQLSEAWEAFLDLLRTTDGRVNDQFADLQRECERSPDRWIAELKSQWVDDENRSMASRLGAIRILARVAGHYEAVWKDTLMTIALDDQKHADMQSWSLFSLHWADISIDENNWSQIGQPIVDLMHNATNAKTRKWATTALSEMARYGHRQRRLHFAAAMPYQRTEEALVKQWYREIDMDVKERLVIALGYSAGSGKLPTTSPADWPPAKVLREACRRTQHRDIRRRVPQAVEEIARTVLHQNAVAENLPVMRELLQIPADHVLANLDSYELQRDMIKAIEGTVTLALGLGKDTPLNDLHKGIIRAGIDCLLSIVSSRQLVKDPDIRTRSMIALKDIAETAQGNAVKFLSEYTTTQLQLLLDDPDERVAFAAVDTLIFLIGEANTAEYFANVILVDEAVRPILQHRQITWYPTDDPLTGHLSTLPKET